MARRKTCLVIGAGAGIGGHVAAKFADEGYHAVLCRRSDQAGLDTLVARIEATGGQIGNRPLHVTTYKQFELGWRMATFGLFRLAKSVIPHMLERGHGTILVTSATAAMRGNAGQHSHAAAMAGRRMLCQTLNAEYAAQGIHIAHIVVDGAVDAPDTLGKMLGPETFQKLRETRGLEHDGLLLPEKIAETYFHIARQHRSVWTHELDLRSFSDLAWWNHKTSLD